MSSPCSPERSDDVLWGVVCWASMIVAVAVALWMLHRPVEIDPAALERARGDVATLAAAPRPRGSEHHAWSREFLVRQLREAGFDVELLTEQTPRPWDLAGPRFEIINILATRDGTLDPGLPSSTVLLMAHYDTRPNSPGAGDDASGVVATLHAARTIPPGHRNRLQILLTDGEEEGLLGAFSSFAHNRSIPLEPLAVVLNFEGRGSSGPVICFETSGAQRTLVGHFAAVAPRPVISSAAADLYRILPNFTDFTVTRRLDIPGLNFAFIGTWRNYHEPTDTPENLSPHSLAHHLLLAERLTARLLDADLTQTRAHEPMVFFDLLAWRVIGWPAGWAVPLAVAVAAGCVGVVGWAVVTRRLRPLAIAQLVLLAPVGWIAAALIVWGVFLLLPGREVMQVEPLGIAGSAMLVIFAATLLDRTLLAGLSLSEVLAGSAVLASMLGLLLSFALAGSSYLLLPWSLGWLLVACPVLVWPRLAGAAVSLVTFGSFLVCAGPLYLILLGTVPNVVPRQNPIFPTASAGVLLLLISTAGLAPLARLLNFDRRRVVPLVVGVGAICSLLLATAPWRGD